MDRASMVIRPNPDTLPIQCSLLNGSREWLQSLSLICQLTTPLMYLIWPAVATPSHPKKMNILQNGELRTGWLLAWFLESFWPTRVVPRLSTMVDWMVP